MSLFDECITYAAIDFDAIAHNVTVLKDYLGPKVVLYAVVKANAYGHGMIPVTRALLESGITHLAVGRVPEGVELRQAGVKAPIMVMGYALPAEAETAVSYDLITTPNTTEGAQVLSDRACALGKTAIVHVKVDSGMGRYGLLPEEALPFLDQVVALPGLELEGLYTHFAVADEADKTYTRQQFAVFMDVLQAVQAAGHTIRIRHAANSAATLDLPEMHLDAVRVGLALYGLYPSEDVSRTVPLQPALSLKSHVARLRTLPSGSSVSYGRAYTTSCPTPIALVPVGYGDGYHRILSNRGYVLIRGQRAPIVGRVCMDLFSVDVSAIEGVSQDDEVVLIGGQNGGSVSAEEVSALAGTINYEVLTNLSARIPRLYLRGGEVVEIAQRTNHA